MPKPPKSIAVGLAQIWLGLMVIGSLWVGYDSARRGMAEGNGSAWLGFGGRLMAVLVASASMIVGMQLRLPWARFGTGIVLTVFAVLQVINSLAAGGSAGTVVFAMLQVLLAWRVVFGEPSRAYFAGRPVSPPPTLEDG